MQPSLREKTSTSNPKLSQKSSSLVGHLTNELGWHRRRFIVRPFCLVALLSFQLVSES
jgi:hypothetical protein